MMVALWMLGATAVPMDFRTNAVERNLLAKEFDLVAIIEDRQPPATGYASIVVASSWHEIIAKHDRQLRSGRAVNAEPLRHSSR